MLNKMPNLIQDDLIASVDRYAKSHFITNANTAILYANELIDEYYLSHNIQPPSLITSLPTDKKVHIPEVTLENNINPDNIPDNTKKPPTADDQSMIE